MLALHQVRLILLSVGFILPFYILFILTHLLSLMMTLSLRPPAAEIVVDCCLTVAEKRMPLRIVQSYTIQEAGKGCEISATG